MENIIIANNNLGNYNVPLNCARNTCVDIGANIGDFTVSQVNNFNVIHFYEPFKPCFDIIQARVKNFKNVTGFNEAVYKESNLKLPMISHINKTAGSNALKTDCINEHWTDDLDSVVTISFTDILNRIGGKINYLKIDCETSEYYLLMNTDLSSVDYIGIELHWQMGQEKYNSLINHILKTHTSNDDFGYVYDLNKEVLFTNRSI